jgi:SAM-dependent methyltransferase
MGSAQVQGRLWGAAAADWSQLNEPAYTPVYEAVFDAVGVGRARGCWTPAAGPGWRCSWPTSAARPSPGSTRQRHYWGGAERVPTADLREGELEALPYPDDSFDTVTAFNAVQVQYAADPVAALRELRRVAVPGAPVAVVMWAQPEHCQPRVVLAAIGALLPPPPASASGPFALSGPGGWRSWSLLLG